MHDTTWLLERAGERFDMTEPALDRLVRRRDRKERNRRIVTAAVALGVSVVGVGIAVATLRNPGAVVPASGAAPRPAEPGDGGWAAFVLPSVALWAAMAALAMVLLALGRLRERPAGPTPPATSADGRRGSTAPEGLTPPDAAKAKQRDLGRREEAMATQVERYPERHTARNVWVTVGVLALLALAIGTGVLLGRATAEEPAPAPEPLGLAPSATVQVVEANFAAMNQADREAFAATFAPEAVFTDHVADDEYIGADAITAAVLPDLVHPGDWDIQRTTEVIQMGDLVANGFTSAQASGISVWEIDDQGLITHQWVMPG